MTKPIKITASEYQSAINGFSVYDCAIRSNRVFSFLLLQTIDDAANGDRRLLNYFPDDADGERLDWMDYEGFAAPKIAATSQPKDQVVLIGRDCVVAVLGGGDGGMESPIPNGNAKTILDSSCHGVATIEGQVYAVGGWRGVCRRLGPNSWESLAGDRSTLPTPKRLSYGGTDGGFNAIAGFNSKNIYCVGGEGDAWRYDGQRWYQCAVPTNMRFESVCCAGDGYVYIGMQSGSVLRGREDKWTIIHKDEMTLPFKDMVWFGGKVWCTSDYGLWVIEDGKLREAPVSPEVKSCSGNLAVGDGVLLLAGMYGATVNDGKQWNRLW
ncbi:hypothetical protein ACIGHN_03465 [Acidovorax sp. NPDC077693]|uniref:hypothetical protein n=1 Tax=unclassified Acidovorax TaxID=2684926 RepID=UPI0037C9ADD1